MAICQNRGSVKYGIPAALQPQVLLLQHPSDLAKHFHSLVNENPSLDNINAINDCLLHQTHTEAVSPSVYTVWLQIARRHSSHILLAALRDNTSSRVRRAGIRIVGILFHSPRWKAQGWDSLGGAAGIQSILETLPVDEVKLFVKAMTSYSYSSTKEQAAACVEELLFLVERSEDSNCRSLLKHMRPFFAHCSSQKVIELLASSPPDRRDLARLAPLHPNILRQIVTGAISMPLEVRLEVIKTCKNVLLGSKNEYVPRYAKGTEFQSNSFPGFAFSMDFLLVLETESEMKTRVNGPQINTWIHSTLRLAILRRMHLEPILLFLRRCLPLYRSIHSNWLTDDITQEIIQWWSIAKSGKYGDSWSNSMMDKIQRRHQPRPTRAHQEILRKLIVEEVLQHRDKNLDVQSRRHIFMDTVGDLLSLVSSECRKELLCLICKHSPCLSFDIMTATPSEQEVQLIPVWDYDVLQKLPPEDAKYLFDRALAISGCDEFLSSADEQGQRSSSLSWKEQCFIWADAEAASAKSIDDLVMTQKVLNEVKQRSMRQRDGLERRVCARTAIEIAVRPKSLEIFSDTVEWSKRFLRDPLVFPDVIDEILSCGGQIFSCQNNLIKPESKADLVAVTQKATEILSSLIKTLLLLLREPGGPSSMRRLSPNVFSLLATTVNGRMKAVRLNSKNGLATEHELVDILLESLVPVIMDYEREGNTEEHEDVLWGGPEGVLRYLECPLNPSAAELAFMDRIARKRDELWQQIRANRDPDIVSLDGGLPKGLAAHQLIPDTVWLSHILERGNEAPYVFSRVNQVLFSPVDVIMAVPSADVEPHEDFVDQLESLIEAYIRGEKLEKEKRAMEIWEHYSRILQPYPTDLTLFQNWLAVLVRNFGMGRVYDRIRSNKPLVMSIPAGSDEIVEWDPLEGLEDGDEMSGMRDRAHSPSSPTILNLRTSSYDLISDESSLGPEASRDNLLSIWKVEPHSLRNVPKKSFTPTREAVILSALLFLDTFTKDSRILRSKFPDEEYPRYPAVYLSDEFLRRLDHAKSRDSMTHAIHALRVLGRDVPSSLLRDLIYSFMDALKADPHARIYPELVWCTFQLLKVLLLTNQPQVIVDVILRVWKDFPNDSSYHRAVSLVKVGRVVTPDQARAFMHNFSIYVCNALRQQRQPDNDETKPLIKVTTVKMLAQSLAEPEFLPQAVCLNTLRDIYSTSRHIDIRVAVFNSMLEMISRNNDADSYMHFSSIALSAAQPSERDTTTEEDWRAAELGGPLPIVDADSDRPILNIAVQDASRKLPESLRADYTHRVILPLLHKSTSQHVRWMSCFLGKLGLSLSDLGLSNDEVGPFSQTLVNTVFSNWWKYLPDAYLKTQQHSLALSCRCYSSFNRIAERFATTSDPIRRNSNAREHWENYLRYHRDQAPFLHLDKLLAIDSDVSGGITAETIIQEYISRARIIIRHPVRYDNALDKYVLRPGFPLEILHNLRRRRSGYLNENTAHREELYTRITGLMEKIVRFIEEIRTDGWVSDLRSYPVTLPTPLQCEIVLLPSPRYNPVSSAWVLDEFATGLTGLIRKYRDDPALLMEIDFLNKVIGEIREEDAATCAILIGKIDSPEGGLGPVESWVRVKLAQTSLKNVTARGIQSRRNIKDMVGTWKASSHELVRQIGWVVDGSVN